MRRETSDFESNFTVDGAGAVEAAARGMPPSGTTAILDLDTATPLSDVHFDVATGIAKLGDELVRWVHVLAAREYTVPLSYDVSPEEALRLAAAVIEWDTGMMEQADSPFHAKGPALSARQVIRGFLPRMRQCELRDVFVDTYGYAGRLP